MDQVLSGLPRTANPNVLVGYETADDAGVYRLTDELALVQTVDFFTPIVDDPFTFGAIAAANSLSDVYAMGGTPISALSVVAFPANGEMDVLGDILRGGLHKMCEAGCAVLGGHSVNDPEIKFGYAVTGTVHPARIKANSGALPGDAVVFTKALGTGVIGTALKRGVAPAGSVDAATASMLTLNRAACEAMLRFEVHGCTDVTGFGMIGHAREMALASDVTIEIETSRVPLLPGALEAVAAGAIPGGLKNNREFASCAVEVTGAVDAALMELLYDPQTSGGLLITLPEADAAALGSTLPGALRIGRVVPRDNKPIRLL
ncbi:MAG: selenide, water dikinase [Bryobacterales bacterium]|nr:selenide, water dikinase [Bryobacterales bacterium]